LAVCAGVTGRVFPVSMPSGVEHNFSGALELIQSRRPRRSTSRGRRMPEAALY